MKLKNKKTGEIATLTLSTNGEDMIIMGNDMLAHTIKLSELKDYEDYEEPKEYWFIDFNGEVKEFELTGYDWQGWMKEIGNYFETREEAQKAVEKLKAWKLLKDECDIKFDGIVRDDRGSLKGVKLSYDRHCVTMRRMQECMNALHLLFGVEE